MTNSHRPPSPSEPSDCPRTVLAENGAGSVEVCNCGLWRLHMGPLTLRLAPWAVSELLSLLGRAVEEHAARRSAGDQPGIPLFRQERGEG